MAPVNDLIANYIQISVEKSTLSAPPTTVSGTTVAGTSSEDSTLTPLFATKTAPSVWYRFLGTGKYTTLYFTARSLATIIAEIFPGPSSSPSTTNVTASVYCFGNPPDTNSGNPPAGPLGGLATFFAEEGQWYYIYVAAQSGTSTGTFSFKLFEATGVQSPDTAPQNRWRPSNIRFIGSLNTVNPNDTIWASVDGTTSSTLAYVASTTKNDKIYRQQLPGRHIYPGGINLWAEPKLARCLYALALIQMPTGNSVSSISQSSGDIDWQKLGTTVDAGGSVIFEMWLGHINSDFDDGTTFTVNYASSAAGNKAAQIFLLSGLDPDTPVLGETHAGTNYSGLTSFNTNFNMSSLLPSDRKGLLLVMWNVAGVDNLLSAPLQFSNTKFDPINADLPGFVLGTTTLTTPSFGLFPGAAGIVKNVVYNNGVPNNTKGAMMVLAADFRHSPHPSWAASGQRHIGWSGTNTGRTGAGAYISGVLLQGAPQA